MLWNRSRKGRMVSFREALRGLRSRIMRDGDPLFCVVGPSLDRRTFPDWNSANEFAADMASLSLGDFFYAQERRVLDGVHCLVRSREWMFDTETEMAL